MASIRKKHTVQTKVKVALEAIKGEKTGSQYATPHCITIGERLVVIDHRQLVFSL